MSLLPHLRAALAVMIGSVVFVGFLVIRLLTTMMVDPNFGRGDNPFELLSLVACVLGAVLALGTAALLAFRQRWAGKVGRAAAAVLLITALSILASMAIAGAEESRPTPELQNAQTAAGLYSFGGAVALYFLLRRLRA